MSTEPTPERRTAREAVLLELTQIPTAAGHEQRVMDYIDRWLAERGNRLTVRRDDAGNYMVTQRSHDGTVPLDRKSVV